MEAIIFDVDGTLWDSTDEVAVSWNEALKRETELRRKVTAEELKKEFGKPLEEIMADLFPELAKEEQIKLSQMDGDCAMQSLCRSSGSNPGTGKEI